ncbi:TcfC E-set like domain-containing protein [Pseudomonas sp. P5_152]|uniref:TcfC E-set like domain-containing protein n=1 Tax=Pseudomonas sp. P5_152 TaxID=3043442 RepID=UPI002A35DE73|nr:TcfC E-set like domain-containing protein [Pseudomonas sp. P5_152]MDX9668005.1 TcfC E-set like domain-containing protein [Pseudomonas sp. P5_152]
MPAFKARCLFSRFLLTTLLVASSPAFAKVKFSYGVPEGFSEAEMEQGASYVGIYNGRTLPGVITYEPLKKSLVFDEYKYEQNGISNETIRNVSATLNKLDYSRCVGGCDLKLDDHYITIDKVKRSISIRDSLNDYLVPDTDWGVVNNQTVDLRASSEGYRATNISGNTWLGMPARTFGYMSWYGGHQSSKNYSSNNYDISTFYLQKNLTSTYLRAGKQNSIDYTSGSVNTLLSPSFDKFVTFGSQNHLQADRSAKSLVLYSTAEGNYEFYRNGRLILKRPAALGRNEISEADLPGGYYSMDVRLVDRNGNLISQITQEINNLNFAGGGENSWHLTAGENLDAGGHLLEGGVSRNLRQLFLNASVISGSGGRMASEVNVTRPGQIGKTVYTPTVGLLSGEQSTGGYASFSLSHQKLGNLMASRYQNNNISHFYRSSPSSSLSYSQNFRGTTLAYNYQKYRSGESQQLETRWNYRPNGLWSTFSVGIQKGGYQQNGNDYGIYVNTSWTLDRSQATFSATHSGGQTHLSGDYRKDYQDTYGTTTAGVTANHIDDRNSFNLYGARSGTRGETSINLGHDNQASNADFNYRGMVAANTQGIAMGRYSDSGSAMLLKTPEVANTQYGFSVEGYPVGGNSTYAVPLNSYRDVPFARVLSDSSDMDMNIEVPSNIIRSHPGQVYNSEANVNISMIYSGFLVDSAGSPISGNIEETGDTVHPNGLFSIFSKSVLDKINVTQLGRRYVCDLKQVSDSYYHCL